METLIEGLAQYGPLGLWTASLLWMNFQQRKENKEDEERAAETLRYHQEQIAEKLLEQKHMLEKAIEKIEGGLTMVREKYAEERLYRMNKDQ
tara:strand:- start:215 stop:490 length:276 start_codon:yes stop_codon:yes gene_type:complete